MYKIGITGGMGAGKSAVLQYLEEGYGASVVRADELAHALERPGQPCHDALVAAFGQGILGEDGELDRGAFAARIFADEAALQRANAIIHPAVKSEVLRQIRDASSRGAACYVLEAALLLEERYDEILDEIWYVYASEPVRRKRLMESRGYSDEKIDGILAQQKSEAQFRAACPVVIDNDGSMEEMRRSVDVAMRGRVRSVANPGVGSE